MRVAFAPHSAATYFFAPPSRGWNARDSLASMPPGFAAVLDNFIARVEECELRGGASDHVTGFSAAVESLIVYQPPGTGARLLAATNQGIYDATTPGPVGGVLSAATNGRWQWVNFANSSGAYVCLVNGVDSYRYWNGSTWTTVATFGTISTSELIGIEAYRQRLFFVRLNSREVYFLPAGAVDGLLAPVSAFSLEQLLRRGGYLMAIGTWTVDAGTGSDDMLACISSEGEVCVFRGTDPANASTWSHVGTYYVGRPLGRRCTFKFGGDLLILTERGIFPLSKAIQSSTIQATDAITYNIEPYIVSKASTNGSNFGWQIEALHKSRILIVNVPGTVTEQLVMHYDGGWSRFIGWEALCFAEFNGNLYFGTKNSVAAALSSQTDFGSTITGVLELAYTPAGYPGRLKHITQIKYHFKANAEFQYSLGINTDFTRTADFTTVTVGAGQQALYDVALWDAAVWASDQEFTSGWQSVASQPGYIIAPALKISTSSAKVSFVGLTAQFKLGGMFG